MNGWYGARLRTGLILAEYSVFLINRAIYYEITSTMRAYIIKTSLDAVKYMIKRLSGGINMSE